MFVTRLHKCMTAALTTTPDSHHLGFGWSLGVNEMPVKNACAVRPNALERARDGHKLGTLDLERRGRRVLKSKIYWRVDGI